MDLLMPALNERRLRTYAGYINEEVEAYLDAWGDQGEVDLLKVMNELTVFIASRCLIGREFRRNLSGEFAALYHDLEGGINLLAFFWPRLPLPSFRRRDRARVRMVKIISKIIADRRAGGREEEDFLQTLMTARWDNGAALTDDNITGMLLTLIFAGQHTSAVQAAWAGHSAAQGVQHAFSTRPGGGELRGRRNQHRLERTGHRSESSPRFGGRGIEEDHGGCEAEARPA